MPAIYPPDGSRRDPQRAAGVPVFTSKDSVLHRPDGDPASSSTVAPGTFLFQKSPAEARGSSSASGRLPLGTGDYQVTWWDPRALALGAVSTFGLRRDDLIVKDGDMFAVEDRLADYQAWRDARAAVSSAAARPSLRIQTATAWAT